MKFTRTAMTLLVVLGFAPVAMQTQPSAEGRVQQDPPPLSGIHTLRQSSSGRFVDAHDTPDKDFRVVTRPRQDNATQRWIFRHVSGRTYTIQQEHTGHFLDAHDTEDRDFAVVTRPMQSNTTQRWLVTHVGSNLYAIQQLSTRRFLDAHETKDRDFAVVTRPQQSGQQSSQTQRWLIKQSPAAAPTTPIPEPTSEACSISGFVDGPLERVLGPDHPGGVSESIRLTHIVAHKADGTRIRAEVQHRRYVFMDLPAGVAYTLAPPLFESVPRSKAVECRPRTRHVVNFRITR